VESARKAGIPTTQIYVVVGECGETENDDIPMNEIIRENEHNVIFTKYVNIDYNAAIFFSQTETGRLELKKYTHFFYAHDTASFFYYFGDTIRGFLPSCNQYIKLERNFSKNMGLFNVEWFLSAKTGFLSKIINYNAGAIYRYKSGDFPNKKELYESFDGLPPTLCEDGLFIFTHDHKPLGEVFKNDPPNTLTNEQYSSNTRLVIPFWNPGVIKYQINYPKTVEDIASPNWIMEL
jgi:hypothetical protein